MLIVEKKKATILLPMEDSNNQSRNNKGQFISKNLTGRSFGSITVLEKVIRGNRIYWKGLCTCGNTTYTRSDSLKKIANCFRCRKYPRKVGCKRGHKSINRQGHTGCYICELDTQQKRRRKKSIERDEQLISQLEERLKVLNEVIENAEENRG